MAESTRTSAPTVIAISTCVGAVDTATLMAIAGVTGVSVMLPVAIGTFVGCSAVALVAMSLVQAGDRS